MHGGQCSHFRLVAFVTADFQVIADLWGWQTASSRVQGMRAAAKAEHPPSISRSRSPVTGARGRSPGSP